MCVCPVLSATGSALQLLVGYENGSVGMWDISTGNLLSELTVHSDAVMGLAYSSAANKGLSASVDENLCAWRNSDNSLQMSGKVKATNPGFNCVSLRSDSKIVATGGWDCNVRVFGLKKLQPLAVLSYHKESVLSVAFSPNHHLAVGSKDNMISIWDIYQQA